MYADLGKGSRMCCGLVSMDTAQTEVALALSFELLAVAGRHSSRKEQMAFIHNSSSMHVSSIRLSGLIIQRLLQSAWLNPPWCMRDSTFISRVTGLVTWLAWRAGGSGAAKCRRILGIPVLRTRQSWLGVWQQRVQRALSGQTAAGAQLGCSLVKERDYDCHSLC
jgi:uncharacterized membrane protein